MHQTLSQTSVMAGLDLYKVGQGIHVKTDGLFIYYNPVYNGQKFNGFHWGEISPISPQW